MPRRPPATKDERAFGVEGLVQLEGGVEHGLELGFVERGFRGVLRQLDHPRRAAVVESWCVSVGEARVITLAPRSQ